MSEESDTGRKGKRINSMKFRDRYQLIEFIKGMKAEIEQEKMTRYEVCRHAQAKFEFDVTPFNVRAAAKIADVTLHERKSGGAVNQWTAIKALERTTGDLTAIADQLRSDVNSMSRRMGREFDDLKQLYESHNRAVTTQDSIRRDCEALTGMTTDTATKQAELSEAIKKTNGRLGDVEACLTDLTRTVGLLCRKYGIPEPRIFGLKIVPPQGGSGTAKVM